HSRPPPRQLKRYAARKRRSSETLSVLAALQVTDSCGAIAFRSSLCQNYHRPIRSSLFKVRPYYMSPMSSRRQHSIETCSGLYGTLATNHTLSSGATTQRSTSLETTRVPRASTYFNG